MPTRRADAARIRWPFAPLAAICPATFRHGPSSLVALLVWLVLASQARAERSAVLVVAHQDDDIVVLYPGLAERLAQGAPVQTVYLTNGNAGLPCGEYTRGRERGVRAIHARLVGVPNVWHEEERTVNGRRVRVATLEGTAHRLWFFGFPNSPEPRTSLEYLWSEPWATLDTMLLDGRSRSDRYDREGLITTLAALFAEQQPDDVLTLDGSGRQPEFYPFEHTDHVHSALFALAALGRYGKARSLTMVRTYSVQLDPVNLPADQVAEREDLFRQYAVHDAKICETGKTRICGQETRCFPLALFMPFMSRRYTIDARTHPDTPLYTRFGRCLEARRRSDGSYRVTMVRCRRDIEAAQHFAVEGSGRVRHAPTGLCLAARGMALGSALTLSPCADDARQRFFLNSQGQLRGPDASCVRSGLRDPVLQPCGLRIRQTSWRVGPR